MHTDPTSTYYQKSGILSTETYQAPMHQAIKQYIDGCTGIYIT